MDEVYKLIFPNLTGIAEKKTSNPDPLYNCIAWAFEDNLSHWWPNSKRSFWPFETGGLTVRQAFEELFKRDGWEQTTTQVVEPGFKKVVLYELNGVPTHAARLLSNGLWTSKLGADIDLSHAIEDLEDSPVYGNAVRIYRKPVDTDS